MNAKDFLERKKKFDEEQFETLKTIFNQRCLDEIKSDDLEIRLNVKKYKSTVVNNFCSYLEDNGWELITYEMDEYSHVRNEVVVRPKLNLVKIGNKKILSNEVD